MSDAADTITMREILDRFVAGYVRDSDTTILSARALEDGDGAYIAVGVREGTTAEMPARFEGVRVLVTEREPGHVAAGPLR
jgi:hypothetical protein